MGRSAKKRTKPTAARGSRGRAGSSELRHRGKTLAERQAERRERLLATGLELFGTRGYGETTIEGICADAHVTARHFYEEFSSREALLRAVYDRVVAYGMGAVTVALEHASGEDPLDRAHVGVRAFVDSMLDDPRRARVQCVQVVGVSADLEQHRRQVLRTFAGLVEREARAFADRGLIPVRPFHIGAMAFVAAVNELVIEALEEPERFPKDAIVEEAVALFVGSAATAPSAAAKKAMR